MRRLPADKRIVAALTAALLLFAALPAWPVLAAVPERLVPAFEAPEAVAQLEASAPAKEAGSAGHAAAVRDGGRQAVAFQQTDRRWRDIPYGYGNRRGTVQAYLGVGGAHGEGSGCGVFAFANAYNYLSGRLIGPAHLAEFAIKHHFRADGSGTTEGLVKSFCEREGDFYGIEFVRKATKLSKIRQDLAEGAAAVAHLDGHYVAVVDYDPATDRYLVLDSAADAARGTAPDGVRWLTEADFDGAMQLKNTDSPLQVFRLKAVQSPSAGPA